MDINNYVCLNKTVLKFVGLYPVNIYRYCICLFCMFLIVVPQIQQIYENRTDFDTILETSSVLLTILLAVLKSLVWITNKSTMEPFIDYMLHDYWEIVTKHHFTESVHTYATYALQVTKGFVFLICTSLLFFFSLPIIEILINTIRENVHNSNKHFPFTAVYPLSFYDSPMYEITYISQMLATSICGLIILATDTFISTALFHTCGHLKTLQDKLHVLGNNIVMSNTDFEEDEKKTPKDFEEYLKNIIQHHQLVLWFCDVMEKMFNQIMLFQTLASSLIICLVGFQVSNQLTEKYKLVEYFSYLLMALFQLLLFSFPGDELIHQIYLHLFNIDIRPEKYFLYVICRLQSSLIAEAAYSAMWYELPINIKNNISMIIMRSQKASYITAGKFCVIHLESFSAVLSTALSYFMLLRSINT